ncbi:MAG TPA: TrkA C-terminal domain-containing protein [Marmoricola sp.]|nr:TrkA C-terminal domain-containing protein [Marmoricola sp.]
MEFQQTLLPGVGVRYDTTTRDGAPISVLLGREGDAMLVTYRDDDPDAVALRLRLTANEVAELAEILGSPRVTARIADLTKEVPGLSSARFLISPRSQYAGRRIGDSKARTRTGCSIVAVVRGDEVFTSPGPNTELRAGDTVVAIGSDDALADLQVLLSQAPQPALPLDSGADPLTGDG